MEKLTELLNKYEKEKKINEGGYVDEDDEYFGRSVEDGEIVNRNYDTDAHGFMKYYIISKDFKFIERLVDNDKIDKNKIATMGKFILDEESTVSSILYSPYESLLMLLAIQDEPLEFLISILNKDGKTYRAN